MMECAQYFGGLRSPSSSSRRSRRRRPRMLPPQRAPLTSAGRARALRRRRPRQQAGAAPAAAPAAAPEPGTYDVIIPDQQWGDGLFRTRIGRAPVLSLQQPAPVRQRRRPLLHRLGRLLHRDKLSQEALLGLEAVDTMGPTLLVVPDASLLPVSERCGDVAKAMMKQAHDKQDRVALLDVSHARTAVVVRPGARPGRHGVPRRHGHREPQLRNHLFPVLRTSIVKSADLDYTVFPSGELADYLLAEWQKVYPPGRTVQGDFKIVRDALKTGWPDAEGIKTLKPKIDTVVADLAQRDKGGAKRLEFLVGRMIEEPKTAAEVRARNQDLVNVFPHDAPLRRGGAAVEPAAGERGDGRRHGRHRQHARRLERSANIALNQVDGPAIRVNDETQADLNKPLDGKAINVIREFVGRGPIVWGARTSTATAATTATCRCGARSSTWSSRSRRR